MMSRHKLTLEQLQRLSPEEYRVKTKYPLVVVADNIRSAMNVGSIFRSCDAFAVEMLVLTGISARPPHKEITKTAIGATDSVEWIYLDDIIGSLRNYRDLGYRIIAVEQTNDAIPLERYHVAEYDKYVVVFGNEVEGVRDPIIEIADDCIEISQFGTKHSLNVSVCAGIVLWSFVTGLSN